MNKSEIIDSFLHEYLTLEDDAIVENDTSTKDPIDKETSILVHSTTAKNYNPADVRNLLSVIYKNKLNSKTNVHKASTSAKKLVVDRLTYISVKNHNITRSTSKVYRVRNHSLIDRGANGGVPGEDIHIRCTRPDLHVEIRGIDNHEINYIPILTVVGVNINTIG